MAKEFEKFEVYSLAINLTKEIYTLLNQEVFRKEFELTNQLKRAVLSISNNIAEGCEYNSNAQFIRYLKYANGSCGEVRNMLNLSSEIFGVETTKLTDDCKIVSVQLSKFIDYLSRTDNAKRL